jgi:hypothetical protein
MSPNEPPTAASPGPTPNDGPAPAAPPVPPAAAPRILPPDRIKGWDAIFKRFATIGIAVKRRRGAAFKAAGIGFRWRGTDRAHTTPYLERSDIRRWVEFATRYSYEEWIARWEASEKKHLVEFDVAEWEDPPSTENLYIGLHVEKFGQHRGTEWVARRESGYPLAAAWRQEAEKWPIWLRERVDEIVEFSDAKRTVPEDFGGVLGRIEKLITPRLWSGTEWLWIRHRNEELIGPSWDPLWERMRTAVDRRYPSAIWTTWHHRLDLDRFTLDRLRAPYTGPDAVGGMRPDELAAKLDGRGPAQWQS